MKIEIYNIVIADDHVLFRQGIKNILEKSGKIKVTGEAGDGLELLDLLKKIEPDMVLLDISMPSLRGLEAAKEIKALWPHIRILILSMHREKEFVHSAISAGADGYLLKEDADTELFEAIEKIRTGERYISPLLYKDMTDSLFNGYSRNQDNPESEPLTTREREVLKLIAEGEKSRKIADMLCISVRTVENHRANITKKLRIKSSADLIKYAIRRGYTSPS